MKRQAERIAEAWENAELKKNILYKVLVRWGVEIE
ncbi:hypothetical protein ACVWXS_005371 [Lysinibacillus sp. TE18511]